MVYVIQLASRIRRGRPDPAASYQQTCMTYTIAVCTVKTPDDGQRNCPKHVEFYSKNKFEKLVNLVGFIIRKDTQVFRFSWGEDGGRGPNPPHFGR